MLPSRRSKPITERAPTQEGSDNSPVANPPPPFDPDDPRNGPPRHWVSPVFTTYEEALEHLRSGEFRDASVVVEGGLTAAEIAAAETTYGFTFPPDLSEFLQLGLPRGGRWADWRDNPGADITERMAWPVDGMVFDVRYNRFWMDEWGPRPADDNEAEAVTRSAMADAPPLIPICGHRYLPSTPCESGNPVLSVYQTDIIYYGTNLLSFLNNELGRRHELIGSIRDVPFWGRLVE